MNTRLTSSKSRPSLFKFLAAVSGMLALTSVVTARAEMFEAPGNPSLPKFDEPTQDSPSDDLRASELRAQGDADRPLISRGPGYFSGQVGIGAPSGLDTTSSMLNLRAAYNLPYTEIVTGRVLADLNLGLGSNRAYFDDIALGANFLVPRIATKTIKTYLGADVGVGFLRDTAGDHETSLAVAGSAGFKWLANRTVIDVSLRYEVLAANVNDAVPSLLSLNAGVDF